MCSCAHPPAWVLVCLPVSMSQLRSDAKSFKIIKLLQSEALGPSIVHLRRPFKCMNIRVPSICCICSHLALLITQLLPVVQFYFFCFLRHEKMICDARRLIIQPLSALCSLRSAYCYTIHTLVLTFLASPYLFVKVLDTHSHSHPITCPWLCVIALQLHVHI